MHNYCHNCGEAYPQVAEWPRQCSRCGHQQYLNPTPVSVLLVPVWNCATAALATPGTIRGIIVGRRGHEPGLGKWGLPGGFVEFNETAEEAAIREMREETGLDLNIGWVQPSHTRNNSTGSQLLAFNDYTTTLALDDLQGFIPCRECDEIRVAWEPEELAFATHTEALRMWFDKDV